MEVSLHSVFPVFFHPTTVEMMYRYSFGGPLYIFEIVIFGRKVVAWIDCTIFILKELKFAIWLIVMPLRNNFIEDGWQWPDIL